MASHIKCLTFNLFLHIKCKTFSDPSQWLKRLPICIFKYILCKFLTSRVIITLWFSAQFSSVTQSCLTLCYPKNCSTPSLPVQHQLLEFTQTHVHKFGDAIQPSHLLLSPSPHAFNLSQHRIFFSVSQFFALGGQSIRVSASASVLPMNI